MSMLLQTSVLSFSVLSARVESSHAARKPWAGSRPHYLPAALPVRAECPLKQYCVTCQKSETAFVTYARRIYSRLMRLVAQACIVYPLGLTRLFLFCYIIMTADS